MLIFSRRRTTTEGDRGHPLGLATAAGLRAGRQWPSQPSLPLASGGTSNHPTGTLTRSTSTQTGSCVLVERTLWDGSAWTETDKSGGRTLCCLAKVCSSLRSLCHARQNIVRDGEFEGAHSRTGRGYTLSAALLWYTESKLGGNVNLKVHTSKPDCSNHDVSHATVVKSVFPVDVPHGSASGSKVGVKMCSLRGGSLSVAP